MHQRIETEIGPIATEWSLVELKEVADKPQYGFTASASKSGNVKFLRITDITDSGVDWDNVPLCECPEDKLDTYLLKSGDIVFARIGATTGKSYLINNPPNAIFASYLIRVRVKNGIDPSYLIQFFQSSSYWKQINANKHNNLKKGVNGSILQTLLVPKPSLDEQKKIAYVLSAVQRVIAQQEQIIQTTTELKKALMHKLFTEGLHGERQKETEIGLVPESWNVVEIGSCCNLSTGTTPSTKNSNFYVGNNPFIRTNQIVNSEISQAEIFVSNEAVDKYNLKIFPPGTVLVAMYGQGKTRGQVALLNIAASITQNAGAITPHDSIISEFLYYYLLSQYSRLRSSGMEGHISHLNLGFLGSFKIPLPSSVDEQKEIIQVVSSFAKKIEVHASKRNILQDLFRTLLHQLMTAEIRVHDIDLPGFDESADVTPQGTIKGAA